MANTNTKRKNKVRALAIRAFKNGQDLPKGDQYQQALDQAHNAKRNIKVK